MRVEGVGDVDLRGNVALGKETMNATALWQSGTGVAVPLRVVPSPTGLPSKRGPGLGFEGRKRRGRQDEKIP